ncbi:MAG: MAPEG family protein [Robiginitomaculum sp.]
MQGAQQFLTPVLALIMWTFVMWVLLYKRRLPAMKKIDPDMQEFIRNPRIGLKIPEQARWAADNYNHLHEQPVLFYALMFYLALTGQGDMVNFYLGWGYVAVRVMHSLVQVTRNIVKLRFGLFILGTLLLMIMAFRAAAGLF